MHSDFSSPPTIQLAVGPVSFLRYASLMNNLEVFGYTMNSPELERPLAFQEVTFFCGPEKLREIARFLNESADEMESMPSSSYHNHIQDWADAWPEDSPDVIVVRANA